jgi:hypothetical protein
MTRIETQVHVSASELLSFQLSAWGSIPTYVKNRRFTVEKFDNRRPRIAVECAIVRNKFRGVKIDDLKTTVNLFKHRDRGCDRNFRFFEKRRSITPSDRR